MCFSVQADVVAGLVLLPVGVLALREVRHVREVPFASLPLVFAAHQLVEAVVWAGTEGTVSCSVQHGAAVGYLIVALVVLPTLVPLAVLLLEPHQARLRVAPFVALGVVVSTYLAYVLATHPVGVVAFPHALDYDFGLTNSLWWAVLYIVAVIGPSVLSGYPSIVAFGVLNLVGLSVVAITYAEAFASLWCVWAGLTSVLVLLHMIRRRRLPDPHRLQGVPLDPRGEARAGPVSSANS
jgi:hypothetical protein